MLEQILKVIYKQGEQETWLCYISSLTLQTQILVQIKKLSTY